MTSQLVWDEAVDRLRSRVSPQNFDMWLRPIEMRSWDGNTLRLRAPNSYVRLWFESNFLSSLVSEIRSLGHDVRVEFDPDAPPAPPEPRGSESMPAVSEDMLDDTDVIDDSIERAPSFVTPAAIVAAPAPLAPS